MKINSIEELHNLIVDREESTIRVVIDNKEYGLSGQYYVIDNTVLFYIEEINDNNANCEEITNLIYNEAKDDCWNTTGYYPYNSFKDCGFSFCFDEDKEWYTVDNWELKYDGDSLYIPTFYCVKNE